MPETQKMKSVGSLFSGAWRVYQERFAVLVKIALIPALFLALGSIVASQGFPVAILGVLFSLAGTIIAIFASIALIIALEHNTDFNESYRKSVSFFWPYLWVSILSGLAAIGGFIMLIVPGIILSVALTFSKYVMVLENRRGLDALAQSRSYTKGYWWAVLGRYLLLGLCFAAVVFVIYVPIALILGKIAASLIYALLLLFITPFSVVYLYEMYKNLVALKPEVHAGHAPAGKTFLTVSAIVGVVGPILAIILFLVLAVMFIKPYMQNNAPFLQQMQYQYEYGTPTSTETSTSTGSPVGMHCGGFIQNAPTCPSGYHCKLNISAPDTGGVCIAN